MNTSTNTNIELSLVNKKMITKKILFVEDEPMMCEYYKLVFEEIKSSRLDFNFQIENSYSYNSALESINRSFKKGYNYDLVLLDIRLKNRIENVVDDGEQLGIYLKKVMPSVKIIVVTSIDSKFRYNSIFQNLRPEGFLSKYELMHEEFVGGIQNVFNGKKFFSDSINNYLRDEISSPVKIGDIDRKLLDYLANGLTTKEISDVLPLSISGIEKRKRTLARKFDLLDSKTASLLRFAKNNGFI